MKKQNNLAQRAINFDLDTNQMQLCLGSKTAGYAILKKEFKKEGFIHRQGSGYVSKNQIKTGRAIKAVIDITHRNPWLAQCVNKIDLTKVETTFDLVNVVKKTAKEQAKAEQKKKKQALKKAIATGSGATTAQQPKVNSQVKPSMKPKTQEKIRKKINFSGSGL